MKTKVIKTTEIQEGRNVGKFVVTLGTEVEDKIFGSIQGPSYHLVASKQVELDTEVNIDMNKFNVDVREFSVVGDGGEEVIRTANWLVLKAS